MNFGVERDVWLEGRLWDGGDSYSCIELRSSATAVRVNT